MKTIKINFHRSRYRLHVPARYMFIASGVPKHCYKALTGNSS